MMLSFSNLRIPFLLYSLAIGLNLNLLAQTPVSLGPDTIVCSSITLDAGITGAAYVWSTGAVTQSIIVSSSDTYWVEVNQGGVISSDTIVVTVLDSIVALSDTSFNYCVGNPIRPYRPAQVGEVFWYDASGTTLLYVGDTLENFQTLDSTQLQLRVSNFSAPLAVGLDTVPSATLGGTRGLTFDAFKPFVLRSVRVYTNRDDSVTIYLTISGNNRIAERTVFVPSDPQGVVVDLFFDVPVGTGHRLLAFGKTGARLYTVNANAGNPHTIPGILSITGDQTNNANKYSFLFDWRIHQARCDLDSTFQVNINILPTAVVDLGEDRLVCDTLEILGSTFPNARFQWSTGDTTATIVAKADTTYILTTFLEGCTYSDTVDLRLLEMPRAISDTSFSFCVGDPIRPYRPAEIGELFWYDATGTTLLHVGDTLENFQTLDSTQLQVRVSNLSSPLAVGLDSVPTTTLGGTRGLTFDAFQSFVLRSVRIFINRDDSVTIYLTISGNNRIAEKTVFVPSNPQGEVVDLFFDVPAGVGNRLFAFSLSGARLYTINADAGNPHTIPGIVSITGDQTNNVDKYSFLFDWRIHQGRCDLDSTFLIDVNILPTPVIDLGGRQVNCGPSLVLNANYPNSTYLWSDGSVDSVFALTQDDTVSVAVTLGQCTIRDTAYVEFVSQAQGGIPGDTTICGPETASFQVNTTDELVFWYRQPGLAIYDLFTSGTLYQEPIRDTTTQYYITLNQGTNYSVGSQAFPGRYDGNTRGVIFDTEVPLVIESVSLYADAPGDVRITLTNKQGDTLATTIRTLPLGTRIKETLPLYFSIPEPGTDFQLISEPLDGQDLGYVFTGATYPYIIEGMMRLKSDINFREDRYGHSFDWQVNLGICPSSLDSVTVSVALPIELGDSIYSCDPVTLNAQNPTASANWNTGAQTQTIIADTSGWYAVLLDDGAGCLVEDSVFVEIPVDAGLPEDGTLCGKVLTTAYDANALIVWNTGDTTTTLSIDSAGVYSVIVAEPRGCVLFDTITVTDFSDFPSLELGAAVTACDSTVITLDSTYSRYLWNTGDTTEFLKVKKSGIYALSVFNENDCETIDTLEVLINPSPTSNFFVADTVRSSNLLVSFINLSSLGRYTWLFGDGNSSNSLGPIHIYADTGTYCVTLITTDFINGCGSDTLTQCFYLTNQVVGLVPSASIEQVQLYPNPGTDYVMIQAPPGIFELEVLDLEGRQMIRQESVSTHSQNLIRVDIDFLTPGVFVLRLQNGETVYHRYFIKQ